MTIEIALYQPDIAANAGTIARLGACLNLRLTIIEPAGFAWSDSSFRRAGLDYLAAAEIVRARSWEDFIAERASARLVLLTTKASQPYASFAFRNGDILLLGRESAGVPDHVHNACQARVRIPMQNGHRSLNVAVAASMVVGEALRQLDGFTS